MLILLVVFMMLQEVPKLVPVVVRWLIAVFGCMLFVTFPQLPDELMIVANVLPFPLFDLDDSEPSESITEI